MCGRVYTQQFGNRPNGKPYPYHRAASKHVFGPTMLLSTTCACAVGFPLLFFTEERQLHAGNHRDLYADNSTPPAAASFLYLFVFFVTTNTCRKLGKIFFFISSNSLPH